MKINCMKALLMAIVLAITTAGCQIQQAEPKHNAAAQFNHRAAKSGHPDMKSKIRNYLLAQNINGSIAIVKNGKILFNEGVGFADFNKKMLNQAATTFPIGSITKTIVAVCVIQLQEKGKLNIQDSVARYIPDFPNGRKIKLIHLLNHTSGVKTPIILNRDAKPSDIMRKIADDEVQFSPGTKWDYNDINYIILGFIVEKVAGIPLHDYIQKNIFAKAMMHHSGFMTQKQPKPYSSVGYVRAGNRLILAKPLNIALLFGCGDIYSTVLDLCRFDQALMAGKLISNESIRKMLTPGSKASYGLGVYNKANRIYSRGVLSGWESIHVFFKDKTAIAVLLNVRDKRTDIHKIASGLYQLTDNSLKTSESQEIMVDYIYQDHFWGVIQ